jgi:hypothetical protein
VMGALGYLLWDRAHPASHAERVVVTAPRPQVEALVKKPVAEPRPPRQRPVVVQATVAPEGDKGDSAPAAVESGALPIAILGTAKGMQSYRLAEPPGLAINLPHGFPRPGASARLPAGIFKKLVVQRKGAGSQIRVYFTSEQNVEVTADGAAIRVALKTKRAGRKS